MMLKKTALALTLGLGLVAAANAGIVPVFGNQSHTIEDPLGTPSMPESEFGSVIHGDSYGTTFYDTLTFTVGAAFNSSGSVGLTVNTKALNLDFISAKLYDAANNEIKEGELKETSANFFEGSGTFTKDAIGQTFHYVFAATVTGTQGGQYTWTLNATQPVPEPETYAMLLAGLGLMGTIARRRNKSKAN